MVLESVYTIKSVTKTMFQLCSFSDTAKQPTIGTSDTVLNGTYLWLMMGGQFSLFPD